MRELLRMDLQLFASPDGNEELTYRSRLKAFMESTDIEMVNGLRTAVAVFNGEPITQNGLKESDLLQNCDTRMICMSLNLIYEQLKRIADSMEKDNGGYDPYEPYDPSRCFMD